MKSVNRLNLLLLLVAALAVALGSACKDDSSPSGADDVADDSGGDDGSGDDGSGDDGSDDDGTEDVTPPETPEEWLLSVPETETFNLEGLSGPVHVVRVEGNIPHIYGANRLDVARVQGYIVAKDRYFMMDLASKLGLGEVSSLVGDAALDADLEARGSGLTYVAQRLLDNFTEEQGELIDAYVDGINAYIEAVRAGDERPPSELRLAGGMLGASKPVDLMEPFSRRRIAGFMAVVVYNLGYETGDVGRAANVARLATHYDGTAFEELRRAGAYEDIWAQVAPINLVSSSQGWGLETEDGPDTDFPLPMMLRRFMNIPGSMQTRVPEQNHLPRVPLEVLERMDERNERQQRRLNRDEEAGYGSNVWGVTGDASTNGNSLLASDGHLPLSIPSLFYQVGFDTSILGGDDFRQVGLIFPGLPYLAVGTNGRVAWSQTQLGGDITDWYQEIIRLDENGEPDATLFGGEWKPLRRIEETYEIADVPVMDSVGRNEVWARWETFDGRWLAEVEGRRFRSGDATEEGEAVVSMRGTFVVPGDLDGDGVITGVSFAYAGFHVESLLTGLEGFGTSNDVHELREWTRHLIAYSQNIIATDTQGNVFYTSYQAVPCRGYLERNEDGTWAEGSHPALLLDGSRYGNFNIPTDEDGRVDESLGESDPYSCVVPFEAIPQAINPSRGYAQNANNDPGGSSFANSLTDEPWYIGGPWTAGYRADTITRELANAVESDTADAAAMRRIQANHDSRVAEDFIDWMLDELIYVLELDESEVEEGSSLDRTLDLIASRRDQLEEVQARLERWIELGLLAKSGVETFYQEVSEEDVESAVATMIFNVWFSNVLSLAVDTERLPGVFQGGSAAGKVRLLKQMFEGRGPDNPIGHASWNPETEESVFWDLPATDELESSTEIVMMALIQALEFLESEPDKDTGGFGTDDMSTWIWGMRHQVRFESLLSDYLGDDPALSILTGDFNITPRRLGLTAGMDREDPRRSLTWFPRDADQWAVDAGNPGFSGQRFTYGSGPVFRMVIELGPDTVRGWNIIPGGQSGLTNSEFFDDQARLWLANETLPMRYSIEDVVEGATGREVFTP